VPHIQRASEGETRYGSSTLPGAQLYGIWTKGPTKYSRPSAFQVEWESRKQYRTDMLALIRKHKRPKGGGLAREGTYPSGKLPPPNAVPAAQQQHKDKPTPAGKRSPEKAHPPPQPQPSTGLDKPDGIKTCAAQKMLPVVVDGCTLQLDIASHTSVQDVIDAVMQLHSTLEWSAVCIYPFSPAHMEPLPSMLPACEYHVRSVSHS
jgi:hypothetical protein